jgi:hypothetical protein
LQTGKWVTVALKISGPVFEGLQNVVLRKKRGSDSSAHHESLPTTMYYPAFLPLPSQKRIFLPSFPLKVVPIFFAKILYAAPLWNIVS